MGTKAADIYVNVEGRTDSLSNALAEVGNKLRTLQQDVKRQNFGEEQAKRAASTMQGLATSVAKVGAAFGVWSLGKSAIKTAIDSFAGLEQSLNAVKVLSNASAAEMQKIEEAALQYGKETKYSAKEAADGFQVLAQAGFSTSQSLASMGGILDLAAGGMISVDKAAETAVSTLGQFGLAADQSAHVADVLVKAAASGQLNMLDLADAMKYVGPAAHAANMGLEETAAAITVLSGAGIKGSEAGTALRASIVRLLKPHQEGAEAMKRLGISAVDAAGDFVGLNSIIEQFASKGARFEDIARVVGTEAASAFQALVSAVRENPAALDAMVHSLNNVDGEARRTAAGFSEGITGAFKRAAGSADTFASQIGKVLAPQVLAFAQAAEQTFNTLADLSRWFQGLPAPIKSAGLAFVEVGAGLVTIGGALKALAVVTGIAIPTIGLLTAGWIAAGAAVAAFALSFPKVREALSGFTSYASSAFQKFSDTVSGALGDVSKIVGDAFTGIINLATTLPGELASAVGKGIDWLGKTLTDIFAPVGEFLRGIADDIAKAFNALAPEIVRTWDEWVKPTYDAFMQWSGAIILQLTKDIPAAFHVAAQASNSLYESFYRLTDIAPIKAIEGGIASVAKGMNGGIEGLVDAMLGVEEKQKAIAAQSKRTLADLFPQTQITDGLYTPARPENKSKTQLAPRVSVGDSEDIRQAARDAKATANRLDDLRNKVKSVFYDMKKEADPLAERIAKLITDSDINKVQALASAMGRSEDGARAFSSSLDHAKAIIAATTKAAEDSAKAHEAVGKTIGEAMGASSVELSALEKQLDALIKTGDKEGLASIGEAFTYNSETASRFNDLVKESKARIDDAAQSAQQFAGSLGNAAAGLASVLGAKNPGGIGSIVESLFGGKNTPGSLGSEVSGIIGNIFGSDAKDALGKWASGLSEATKGGILSAMQVLPDVLAAVGKIGKSTSESIKGVSQTAGAAIGSALGSPQLGSMIGKVVGRGLSHIFGDGLKNPDTKARKKIEKWLEDIFTGVKAKFLNAKGIFEEFSGNFVFGSIKKFNDADWGKGFDKFGDAAKTTFTAIGEGIRTLQGITEDVGGQIGLILAENLGGSIDNARLLVERLGLSFDDLSKKAFEAASAGTISWHEYNVEIQGLTNAFGDGLVAVGDFGGAFRELISSGGRGIEALKGFRDVAVEAMEAGVKTMAELRDRLVKGGMDPKDVEALFAAAAQRGITTLEGWRDASKETAGAIVGDMYALSSSLAKRWDEMAKTLGSIQAAMNSIPDKVEKSLVFNVQVNDDSGILDKMDNSEISTALNATPKKFAKGGIVSRATAFRFAGGLGVMGEAGAEAILPLTRKNGVLGVHASGGGRNSPTFVYNIDATGAQVGVSDEILRALEAVEDNAVYRAMEAMRGR